MDIDSCPWFTFSGSSWQLWKRLPATDLATASEDMVLYSEWLTMRNHVPNRSAMSCWVAVGRAVMMLKKTIAGVNDGSSFCYSIHPSISMFRLGCCPCPIPWVWQHQAMCAAHRTGQFSEWLMCAVHRTARFSQWLMCEAHRTAQLGMYNLSLQFIVQLTLASDLQVQLIVQLIWVSDFILAQFSEWLTCAAHRIARYAGPSRALWGSASPPLLQTTHQGSWAGTSTNTHKHKINSLAPGRCGSNFKV